MHYAQSQPHTHVQNDPAFHTLTQPLIVHQPYAQRAETHAAQTCDYLPPPTTSHALPTEQPTPQPSSDTWQTVNRKRHRNAEDSEPPSTTKTDYWLGETLRTNNRFSALMDETVEDSPKQSTDPKPPPIFISGVVNIKPLTELLNSLAPNKYLVKTLSNYQVRVQPTESAVYTAIIKALMVKNTEFHTYKPRQDRSFRVVLKNLHPSTEVNDIKQALKEGHEATNIWNVKQRSSNHPLPMHFIDLKPNTNNDIYRINMLLNSIVKFEAPQSKREIPQCMRCQKYGHTKNYCRNTPRCVKCAEHHLTSDCPRKTQDGNVTCVNCNQPHPANYRGCEVHKQLHQKIYPKLRERDIPTPAHTATTARPFQNGITYAQAVQGQPSAPHLSQHRYHNQEMISRGSPK